MQQLEALTSDLDGLLGSNGEATVALVPAKKGKFSPAGLERLRAAQKARWAKIKKAKGVKGVKGADEPAEKPKRRKMSAAGRARIAAGARARWAKVRAEKTGK